jgi:hypothetical protein
MATQIQELEELVGARENTIEVLEDQLMNTQQQLEESSSLDTAGSGRSPSLESSVASFAH